MAAACAGGADPTTTTGAELTTTTSEPPTTTTSTLATTTTTEPPPPIEVVASDFAFDMPETIPVGTRLSLFNSSATEFHEMVVIYLRSDDRTLESIVEMDNPVYAGSPTALSLRCPEKLTTQLRMG